MTAKEIYPILVSAKLWGSQWSGKRILVHCDNEAAVRALNKGYSSKEHMARMLRCLVLVAMTNNFTLKVRHIP